MEEGGRALAFTRSSEAWRVLCVRGCLWGEGGGGGCCSGKHTPSCPGSPGSEVREGSPPGGSHPRGPRGDALSGQNRGSQVGQKWVSPHSPPAGEAGLGTSVASPTRAPTPPGQLWMGYGVGERQQVFAFHQRRQAWGQGGGGGPQLKQPRDARGLAAASPQKDISVPEAAARRSLFS